MTDLSMKLRSVEEIEAAIARAEKLHNEVTTPKMRVMIRERIRTLYWVLGDKPPRDSVSWRGEPRGAV